MPSQDALWFNSGHLLHTVKPDSPSLQVKVLGERISNLKLCWDLNEFPRLRSILSLFHLPWSQALQVIFRSVFNFHSKYLQMCSLRDVPEIPGPMYLMQKRWTWGDLLSAESTLLARESNRVGEDFSVQWDFSWQQWMELSVKNLEFRNDGHSFIQTKAFQTSYYVLGVVLGTQTSKT